MEVPPETRYVDRDGKALAYQVFGEGPNLVIIAEVAAHLGLIWTDPGYTRLWRRFGGQARIALFERLGFGLSDPLSEIRTVEDQAGDILAVMDAAGMDKAVIGSFFSAAPGALVAAARAPDRVLGLSLSVPLVQGWRSAPVEELVGWSPEGLAAWEAELERMVAGWGSGASLRVYAPGMASPRNARRWGLLERSSVSPGTMRALLEASAATDVRSVLPLVRAPTVVQRHADHPMPVEAVRQAAELIPGARWVETPAARPDMDVDEFFAPFGEASLELLGIRERSGPAERRLATVLFTDIVGSTDLAGRLGDREWRALLERHDELVRRCVTEGGGRVVKHLGDGALSVFDGPAQAIRAAEQLLAEIGGLDLELRAGIHTGECELVGDDLAGMAVHIGARVGAAAGAGEILVSRTVHDLVVGSGIGFVSRGEHELKGVAGAWELFAVHEQQDGPIALDPTEDRLLRPSDRMILVGARRAPGLVRRVNGLLTRGR